ARPLRCLRSLPRCLRNTSTGRCQPQQTVPTSASSLSSGFPRGIRFLGNPTQPCCTPDRLLPEGEAGTGYFVPLNHLAIGVGVSAVRRGCNGLQVKLLDSSHRQPGDVLSPAC